MTITVSILTGMAISSATLAKIVGWNALRSASLLWLAWSILCIVTGIGVHALLKPTKSQKLAYRPRQFKTFRFTEKVVEEPIGNGMVEVRTVVESVEENRPCTTCRMKGGRIA